MGYSGPDLRVLGVPSRPIVATAGGVAGRRLPGARSGTRHGLPAPAPAQWWGARLGFDHLLSTYGDFEPFVESSRPSPFIDTTGGMDGYLGRASRTGKDNMGQARRRTAKAERELGPVRFEADIIDHSALQRVIAMKRAQYASTGARDYFADPRRAALLEQLSAHRDPEFAGMLSTVHAGPHLLAAHFGIPSGPVLHWWFPVFDSTFANLSPGWILLREFVTAAPTFGIGRIDLGRGDDEYKRRAKTGEVLVSQGVVQRSTPRRVLRRAGTSEVAQRKPLRSDPGCAAPSGNSGLSTKVADPQGNVVAGGSAPTAGFVHSPTTGIGSPGWNRIIAAGPRFKPSSGSPRPSGSVYRLRACPRRRLVRSAALRTVPVTREVTRDRLDPQPTTRVGACSSTCCSYSCVSTTFGNAARLNRGRTRFSSRTMIVRT